MEIKVLGSGCSKCRSTIGIIERAAQASGVDVEIVKVENPDEIKRAGVRATPAVMIDGKVVHSGGIPSHEEVQTWLKPGPIGFLNHPTRHLFFTGKGGVGKTSLSTAAALTLADAGKKSAAGQHRRRVEPRRDARHRASQHARSRARRARPVGAEHRPRQRSRVLSPAGSGADGCGRQRRRTLDRARATVRRLHHGDRLLRRVLVPLVRRRRDLRPHRLRHGTDGAHLAAAQPAQGMDRVPGRQRSRRLLPGAAFGPEDAGSALQGRARRPERSGEDHGDPGDATRQGRHRRSGAHLGRVARTGLEQPAAGDQWRVPRQRAHRRGGLRHRGPGAAGAGRDASVAARTAAGPRAAAGLRYGRPARVARTADRRCRPDATTHDFGQ